MEEGVVIEVAKAHEPLLFTLYREKDEGGVSGTGRVLDGTLFHNGWVVICWRTDVKGSAHGHSSIGVYPSWQAFAFIHIDSHPSNDTRVEWLSGGPECP